MKNVILIRHIKSDWSNLLSDFDRPVREDRKEDARLVAQEVINRGHTPELIISSDAVRTYQTATVLSMSWGLAIEEIITMRSLYNGTAKDVLSVIRMVDPRYNTIVVVCHNPAITDFINQYSDSYLANVPTTGTICMCFDTATWVSVNGKAKTNFIIRPKELKSNSLSST